MVASSDFPWYETQVNPVTGVWLFARYSLLINRQRESGGRRWMGA